MKTLLLLLLCCCGLAQLSVIRTKTFYNSWPWTWSDARKICQWSRADMLIVQSAADVNVNTQRYRGWCGLHRPSPFVYNSEFTSPYWQWVNGDHASVPDFYHEPSNDATNCATASSGEKVSVYKCHFHHFSFCQDSTGAFTFVNKSMSWWRARDHCESLGQTLATFDPKSNDSPAKVSRDYNVWTGLRHSGEDSCVAISSKSRRLSLQSCSEAFPVLCDRHNLVLQQEELSWDQALEHCRNLSSKSSTFRLLSVDPGHMQYVLNHALRANTSKVWVGLRFLAGSWFWSDGAPVSLSLPSCPEFHCGALVVNTSSIQPSACSQKLSALCYKEP